MAALRGARSFERGLALGGVVVVAEEDVAVDCAEVVDCSASCFCFCCCCGCSDADVGCTANSGFDCWATFSRSDDVDDESCAFEFGGGRVS